MAIKTEKSNHVIIKQISANNARVFGFGDDGKVYVWDAFDAKWLLYIIA